MTVITDGHWTKERTTQKHCFFIIITFCFLVFFDKKKEIENIDSSSKDQKELFFNVTQTKCPSRKL